MATIEPTMSTKAINKALAAGGDVCFMPGRYKLADTLVIVSNTRVKCEQGVLFTKGTAKPMIRTKVSENTTKYNGAHDIVWDGGVFMASGSKAASNMIEIIHASNVTIKNATLHDCNALHFIEIHASSGVMIQSCRFENHKTAKGKEHKEAIQLDFANYDGLKYADQAAKTYDATHCKDIAICDCIFTDVPNAIGTHTETTTAKYHENIQILDNKMIGRGMGQAIKIINMRNVSIYGNKIAGFTENVWITQLKTGHDAHGGTGPVVCAGNKNIIVGS